MGVRQTDYSTSAIDPNTSALAGGLSEGRAVGTMERREDAEAMKGGVIRMMIGAREDAPGVVEG